VPECVYEGRSDQSSTVIFKTAGVEFLLYNTPCLKKTCCRIFATTSSTVHQFWKFLHCWIQR